MKYVYLALNWTFGVIFVLLGLAFMINSLLAGLCLALISLFLLPPVRNFIHSKTNIKMPTSIKAVSILMLLVAVAAFNDVSQDKRAAELATLAAEEKALQKAKNRQKNIDYFNEHREEIITSVSAALTKNDYKSVISKSGKYLAAKDAELNRMYKQAKDILDEIAKAEMEAKKEVLREERTNNILAELKHIPASEFKKNKDLYNELANLNPDNLSYKEKFDLYSKNLADELEKEKLEQEKLKKKLEVHVKKFGKAPTQSSWDGSYYVVELYLKKIANDPDSIEMDGCTKVYHIESGWLVGCDYRGRNGFGGMIRQSNWFTINHDRVIQMHEASAFRR